MSAPAWKNIYRWARFALTGDFLSDNPDDETLFTLATEVLGGFLVSNPCVSDGTGGYSTLNPADANSLEKAVGALTAGEYLATPAGASFIVGNETIKTGPVTETTSGVRIESIASNCVTIATKARLNISCIRLAQANSKPVELFGTVRPLRRDQQSCGRFGRHE